MKNVREVWCGFDGRDEYTEEVDESHVHQHVILGLDHLECSIMEQSLAVFQAHFALDLDNMGGHQSMPI